MTYGFFGTNETWGCSTGKAYDDASGEVHLLETRCAFRMRRSGAHHSRYPRGAGGAGEMNEPTLVHLIEPAAPDWSGPRRGSKMSLFLLDALDVGDHV